MSAQKLLVAAIICGAMQTLGCETEVALKADTQVTDTAPVSECANDTECDDQRGCTIDRCEAAADGRRACTYAVAPGTCLIDNVCANDGEARSGSTCEACQSGVTASAWTAVADGTACDDASLCTTGETCLAGACNAEGRAIDCDDQEVCTRDFCVAATGCQHEPVVGGSCDDGDGCTEGDHCASGVCKGTTIDCGDDDPCTTDSCASGGGCLHAPASGNTCEDGDLCTRDDLCADGVCVRGADADCDDLNPCTIDFCDALVGCAHLPTQSPCCVGATSVCDDGNGCTNDFCDPLSGECSHEPNSAGCDDNNPCTVSDMCLHGICGGEPRGCDDGEPCTTDSCDASYPGFCFHTAAQGGSCNDGIDCTIADTCQNGKCRGDASQCVCTPTIAADGSKLTSVEVGGSGQPGDGLDVDGDPATCSPVGQCAGGVDNTLSIIASIANGSLATAVASGQVLLVVTFTPLNQAPLEVAVYQASATNAGCDIQAATCDYQVDKSFLDPATCQPIARLQGKLVGTHLTGGGPGTRLPFVIPFSETAALEVTLENLVIDATVSVQNGQVAILDGLIGGAVSKQTLLDGLATLPEGALPVPKDTAISLVDTLVQNDIDTDGDGAKDAASIGIKIHGIDATVSGVRP